MIMLVKNIREKVTNNTARDESSLIRREFEPFMVDRWSASGAILALYNVGCLVKIVYTSVVARPRKSANSSG